MQISKKVEIDKVIDLLNSTDWNQKIRGLSKAITLIENDVQSISLLLSRKSDVLSEKKGHVIGITGLPGAGKSTLTNLLIKHLRSQGKSLCVLAIDPSSNDSGGAILGDRIRMQQHFHDDHVFIRSMGARGALGGLANATETAIAIAQTIPFDYVLVETVGVGQSESEIIHLAETTVLVLMPNSGDEIQLMKSGLIELADIYVINKCDLSDATWMEQELKENAHRSSPDAWSPAVVKTSALKEEGIDLLAAAIDQHQTHLTTKSVLKKSLSQSNPKSLQIKKINHLGVVPKDLATAQHFFSHVLKLKHDGSEQVQQQKVLVDFYQCGQTRLELLKPTSEESPISKFLATKGSGIHHIALEVDHLDDWIAYLSEHDIEMIDHTAKSGAHHTRIAFIHPRSTGGILVELVEEAGFKGHQEQ